MKEGCDGTSTSKEGQKEITNTFQRNFPEPCSAFVAYQIMKTASPTFSENLILEPMKSLKYFFDEYSGTLGRILIVLYLSVMWLVMFLSCAPCYLGFFSYLTNWGWSLLLIYFAYSLVTDWYVKGWKFRLWRMSFDQILARRLRQQMLAELALVAQIVIVFLYWTIVHPKMSNEPDRHLSWDIQFHGVGLFLILLDFAFRRIAGFSLRNHKVIVIFGCAYVCCHTGVVLATGVPVYPGIHFRDVYSFCITLGALLTLVLTHKVIYILSQWKRFKSEMKSFLGISHVLLLRHNSIDVSAMHLFEKSSHGKARLKRAASYDRQCVDSNHSKSYYYDTIAGEATDSDTDASNELLRLVEQARALKAKSSAISATSVGSIDGASTRELELEERSDTLKEELEWRHSSQEDLCSQSSNYVATTENDGCLTLRMSTKEKDSNVAVTSFHGNGSTAEQHNIQDGSFEAAAAAMAASLAILQEKCCGGSCRGGLCESHLLVAPVVDFNMHVTMDGPKCNGVTTALISTDFNLSSGPFSLGNADMNIDSSSHFHPESSRSAYESLSSPLTDSVAVAKSMEVKSENEASKTPTLLSLGKSFTSNADQSNPPLSRSDSSSPSTLLRLSSSLAAATKYWITPVSGRTKEGRKTRVADGKQEAAMRRSDRNKRSSRKAVSI